MELKKETISGYTLIDQPKTIVEQGGDCVIPDRMPDAVRIISTYGAVSIDERDELSSGEVSGKVKLSAIYADDEGKPQCIECELPYSVKPNTDGREIEERFARAYIRSIDARMINSRKLAFRVSLLINSFEYDYRKLEYAAAVADDDTDVQTKISEKDTWMINVVKARRFGLDDDLELPAAKPPIGKLFSARTQLRVDEFKKITNKLILRGIAETEILYMPENGGNPTNAGFVTPFSQIIEANGITEDSDCRVSLHVLDSSYEPLPAITAESGGRILRVAIRAEAQMICLERKRIAFIEDAYSLCYDTAMEKSKFDVISDVSGSFGESEIRDSIPTSTGITEVHDVSVTVLPPSTAVHDGQGTAVSESVVSFLYSNEAGEYYGLTKRYPVEWSFAAMENSLSSVLVAQGGKPGFGIDMAGTNIELRFHVDFNAGIFVTDTINPVTELTLTTEKKKGSEEQPSFILRAVKNGETLFEIGKRYNTTECAIRGANEMDDCGEISENRMILIPIK